MKPLVITPGDPRGIGPELVARVLVQRRITGEAVQAVIIGDSAAMVAAAKAVGLRVRLTGSFRGDTDSVLIVDPGDVEEPVEAASIRAAVAACLDGRASGLVTGPIHKATLMERGFAFPGHTEFLGHLCGVERPVMAFAGGRLRVVLATVHVPLRAVAEELTQSVVEHTVRTAHAALQDQLGIPAPRLLVCGLNPHAGEDGKLGTEEQTVIGPAIAACRAEGIDAVGPISAEATFRMALAGHGDLVVAMYHDQGLAPLKLVDFGKSVNWTLGLPIVRTSVDHGTARELVGTGRADPSSMDAAIRLAERLVRR